VSRPWGDPVTRPVSPALTPPPGNSRFPLLDAARGGGCLAVVIAHGAALRPGTGVLVNLLEGITFVVPAFFAFSGFLLLRPFLSARAAGRPEPRLGDYFQRRALRVLPGYWFALVLSAVLLGPQLAPGVFGGRWWVYFGFTQVYSGRHIYDGISVAWSLCVEVSFYVLLPLLVAATGRLGRRLGWQRGALVLLLPLLVLGPAVRLLNTFGSPTFSRGFVLLVQHLTYALPGECNFFAIGMIFAVLSVHVRRGGRLPRPIAWIADHAGLAWLGMLVLFVLSSEWAGFITPESIPGLGVPDFRTRFLASDVCEMALVALLLIPAIFPTDRERLPHRMLRSRVLGFAGVISFGFYLYHWQIGLWLLHHTALHRVLSWPMLTRWPVLAAVLLIGGGAAGAASYRFIELPFLRHKAGWSPAAAAAPPAAPDPVTLVR
jgi:peptidoglycan/LPS O-acetylase OafA/YrhL